MSNPKLKVILTVKLPDAVETRMRELFNTTLWLTLDQMPRDKLFEAAKTADVLVSSINDRLDAEFFDECGEQLKMIANFGVGYDHIDIVYGSEKGIIITNTPGVLTEDTAEMTMGLILAVSRRFVEGAEIVQKGEFSAWSPTFMLGRRVFGKRLGIVGMGRIGQALARRARAFGMSVHYHNRKPVSARISDDLQATYWDDLDQMLSRMDVVSINAPGGSGTHHLLSAERLAKLQPHALLVNTARGQIVDEQALAAMLRDKRIAGVGLDVYEREPAINPELIGLPNAILLPHMASSTIEARQDMGDRVILNVKTFQDGHRPPDRVIPAML
ncbi:MULTISPECIES: D-glycerate dehydrogenase [Asticcacaulis]|uniref:2-hydroxyacid dehydrogenase n=1 Tax=Asticcacaulis TaxID=76890 RepID=UPI001AEA83EF|nr:MULTISPECIES: D-glycerate dehydrogenase [Asticcacaulis]MBP2159625.1 glyoxylate reductase [Asticcacaulis solisilvae]MDR6800548.1 glyoxylate reductase [Asticcacaulis sp. BE141]